MFSQADRHHDDQGTAISMIRLPGAPDGDQCLLRIKSTSMPLLTLPERHG
jgi:hypothetical protein